MTELPRGGVDKGIKESRKLENVSHVNLKRSVAGLLVVLSKMNGNLGCGMTIDFQQVTN